MKTFAIGDIHGCYDELMALMEKLKKEADLDPERDTVVFLGDYSDRGPKSKQVVSQLIKWEKKYPHWQFLMGNHEDLMLDALLYHGQTYNDFDLWWDQGGKETAQSYFPKGMSKYDIAISQSAEHVKTEHLQWLAKRPRFYEDDKYFFVHAGVIPGMSLDDMIVESDMPHIQKNMLWIRDLFIDSEYDWGKKIIFGHTAIGPDFNPIIMKNKIGIDTAVCAVNGTGKLTAIELPSETLYAQPALRPVSS